MGEPQELDGFCWMVYTGKSQSKMDEIYRGTPMDWKPPHAFLFVGFAFAHLKYWDILNIIELYGSEIQPDQPGISTAKAAENHQEGLAMDEFV